jgi:hypothetical protein
MSHFLTSVANDVTNWTVVVKTASQSLGDACSDSLKRM